MLPKTGKTTIASKFPRALIAAFEKGFGAIPGIMAQPIDSWSDFRKLLTQLKNPAVQEKFWTVVIDTADIAYALCEKYICSRESTVDVAYETIADLPYGKGYALAQQEFDEILRRILQLGYGLVIISHEQDKTLKNEKGEEYQYISPSLNSRARLVCERTCDIIGYARVITDENGKNVTKLFMRETPRFAAGSRFKYTPDVIDFNYESLVEAIAHAVELQEQESGIDLMTNDRNTSNRFTEETKYNFSTMMEQFQEIVSNLMQADQSNANKITAIVEKYLGKGRKVSECTDSQAAQLDLILDELKQL